MRYAGAPLLVLVIASDGNQIDHEQEHEHDYETDIAGGD
jgi:hypothetical protein